MEKYGKIWETYGKNMGKIWNNGGIIVNYGENRDPIAKSGKIIGILTGAKRRDFSGMIHNFLVIVIPATPSPIHSLLSTSKTENIWETYGKHMEK